MSDLDRESLVDERDHLLASLRDLDAERAAGDIDDIDYAALRDQYVARAAAALRALDAGEGLDAVHGEAVEGPSIAPAPGRRAMRLRAAATVVIVGLVAVGAGLVMARGAGERLPGQEVSGAIPANSGDRVAQAQALAAEGRILDAIKLYDKALADEPNNPVALAQRGWLVSRAGLADDGLATIEKAIAIDPAYPDAWFFKGMILWRLKNQPAEARAAFEQLLALDPPKELVDFVRTEVLPQLG